MKKYLVIGNPIEHSLSPKLHNHWFEKNNINAIYNKKQINEIDIKDIISELRNEKINGINVTVPFKQSIIPFVDELSAEANNAQSVNTIYKENNKVLGHNTDISGFELAMRGKSYDIKGKKIFILGAGGVVPSIILALKKMGANKIILNPYITEKTFELVETEKKICFIVEKTASKLVIKDAITTLYEQKVIDVNTARTIYGKKAFVEFESVEIARDLATKIGML